jgi:hypothetical protein
MIRWVAGNGAPAACLYGSEQMNRAHQRKLAAVKTAFVVSRSIKDTAITTTLVRAPFNREEIK